ncbi:hypothetical protein BJ508DRAFT_310092 [Ascobolus immersus RN42]|uniref:Uncharacterized protein n=1 Tax=Ascobolus immersus RN42 TaxID=1160509 RepID=A0A3N4HWE0_ASCIM|nr:hypothetical protein BJ508DRAFT_310092 [Ascobolus immersus RN42]
MPRIILEAPDSYFPTHSFGRQIPRARLLYGGHIDHQRADLANLESLPWGYFKVKLKSPKEILEAYRILHRPDFAKSESQSEGVSSNLSATLSQAHESRRASQEVRHYLEEGRNSSPVKGGTGCGTSRRRNSPRGTVGVINTPRKRTAVVADSHHELSIEQSRSTSAGKPVSPTSILESNNSSTKLRRTDQVVACMKRNTPRGHCRTHRKAALEDCCKAKRE